MNNRMRKRRAGCTWIELLVVSVIVGVLFALLLPLTRSSREGARRSQCKHNLKQIGLALHHYHDHYRAFPPAYTVDANGKPLHSWRTLILPWLDQAPLYSKIDLSKPWDDPVNAAAFQSRPPVYVCPSTECPPGYVTYLGVEGPKAFFSGDRPRAMSEITDGTSQTLMVVEVPVQHAVHWMAPQDANENLLLSFNVKTFWQHQGGTHGLLADGSVPFLSEKTTAARWRSIITIAGCEDCMD